VSADVARPSSITDERRDAVERTLAAGAPLRVAAASAGVSARTVSRWLEDGLVVRRSLSAVPDELDASRELPDDDEAIQRELLATVLGAASGIPWPENGKRPQRTGFKTKTEARRWFAENVVPRLGRSGPSSEITFDAFCDLFLSRHGATVGKRTKETLEERLSASRDEFGSWTLAELEGAAADVAAWRAALPERSRYRLTLAMRQALAAAVRWRYLTRNPAVEAGRNPEPRSEELRPFTRGNRRARRRAWTRVRTARRLRRRDGTPDS
jgi:hypothetical protein